MDEQKELGILFRQQQEKYTYYIIALSVASIGFSVNKTTGMSLSWVQIPLGIAIISWSISIHFGIRFLIKAMDALWDNIEYFQLIKKKGDTPQNIEIINTTFKEIMKEKFSKASKFYKWQYRLYALGVIFFLLWHILEMYKKTI